MITKPPKSQTQKYTYSTITRIVYTNYVRFFSGWAGYFAICVHGTLVNFACKSKISTSKKYSEADER